MKIEGKINVPAVSDNPQGLITIKVIKKYKDTRWF